MASKLPAQARTIRSLQPAVSPMCIAGRPRPTSLNARFSDSKRDDVAEYVPMSGPVRPSLNLDNFQLEKEIEKFSRQAAKWRSPSTAEASVTLAYGNRATTGRDDSNRFSWDELY